jgi:hypothetical protein
MNCATIRNRILALTDPAVMPDAVRQHVEECSACKTWHTLSVQVDTAVAAMSYPESDGKAKRQLMSQFEAQPVAAKKPSPAKVVTKPTVQPAAPRQPLGERLARMWPLGLVAAAVLVGAIAWAIFGGKSNDDQTQAKAPADPMLKDVVVAKVELDRAGSAPERMKALAKLADTLHDEARTLARITPGEDMTSLASMYRQVVQQGLVPQARELSDQERKATLPKYAERLSEAEQEANRLAEEVPVGSKDQLKEIAEVARAGRIELAKLIQGRAS